jgi:hypothetical protein
MKVLLCNWKILNYLVLFIGYSRQQIVKFLNIDQRLVINYENVESVMRVFKLCYLNSKFWNFNSGQFNFRR